VVAVFLSGWGCVGVVCWKLVRDGVASAVGGDGVRVLRVEGEALEALLRAKVVEEAMEFAESGSLEEVADLLEALGAWLRLRGVDWGRVEELRRAKKAERGGFEGGFVVVWPDRDVC
jgi:predicted house-cleaning noncanonical NTP pyrophosphatase (MazG superfamily)